MKLVKTAIVAAGVLGMLVGGAALALNASAAAQPVPRLLKPVIGGPSCITELPGSKVASQPCQTTPQQRPVDAQLWRWTVGSNVPIISSSG